MLYRLRVAYWRWRRRGPAQLFEPVVLFFNRLRFHLFFKRQPLAGEHCNSKRIRLVRAPAHPSTGRPNLVIVRCGSGHGLIKDRSARSFDIALNMYADAPQACVDDSDYLYVGGINKFKAAREFLTEDLIARYEGFMLLDDDLEITYSKLDEFLAYCVKHGLEMAQPSLVPDCFYTYEYLVSAPAAGHRAVALVEVMCPYFSRAALKAVVPTFDLSISTWGLDQIWPRLLTTAPVVVDQVAIRHTRPVGTGGFYGYMRSIGISPARELARLTRSSWRQWAWLLLQKSSDTVRSRLRSVSE